MSLKLTADAVSDIVTFLRPFAKMTPLDGSTLSASLEGIPEGLLLTCVPDIPRVTGIEVLVEGEGQGRVSLALQRLLDMCGRSAEGLELELRDDLVVAGLWQTPLLPYRALPTDFTTVATVDAHKFSAALSSTRYAASTDAIRPRLSLVHFGSGYARACDGVQYHEQRSGLPAELEWDVPVRAAIMIERLASMAPEGMMSLGQTDTHQEYVVDGARLVLPRPSVSYLDLEQVVAQPARAHNHHLLKVDKGALAKAVRDVSIMAGEESTIRLDIAANTVTVSANDGSLNAGRCDVPCEWAGENRTLRFTISSFLRLLGTSNRELIELRLGVSTLRALTPIVLWEDDSFALLNQARGG